MALSASDLAAIYSLLTNSMSQNQTVRKPAETALSQSESRPGFCSCLMEVITAKDLVSQVDLRLMASGFQNQYQSVLEEETRFFIAQMLAVLISKIARVNYPREWLELFSFLAQQLPSVDALTSHRIFMILFRTLKELTTKRLTADQRKFARYPPIYLSIAGIFGRVMYKQYYIVFLQSSRAIIQVLWSSIMMTFI